MTASTTAYLVYNDADPALSQNQASPSLGVVAITGTPSQANVVWTESNPYIAGTLPPPSAVQPNGAPNVATDDDRLLSAVWQNGTLWTVSNESCTPLNDTEARSCAHVSSVNTMTTSATLTADFDYALAAAYVYYPAVALDATGNAFITFTESSTVLNPSAMVIVEASSGAPNENDTPTVVYDGARAYNCGSLCTVN